MYSYELIQQYMNVKNYTKAKQAAIDLGYSDAFLSKIKSGQKNISEESAIYIAQRCGLNVDEVLIKLQIEKSRNETEKSAWSNMLAKFEHGIKLNNSITYVGLLAVISH